MSSVIIGICDINERRHFVGIWPDIDTAKDYLKSFVVKGSTVDDLADAYGAVRCYEAEYNWEGTMPTGITDEEERTFLDEHPDYYILGDDVDGFSLYEVPVGTIAVPGFDQD